MGDPGEIAAVSPASIEQQDSAGQAHVGTTPSAAEAILAAVHDAVISTSADGIILTWNAAAERIYGYAAVEAVGRGLALLFFPDEASTLDTDLLQPTRRTGRHERFSRTRKRDGTDVYVSFRLTLTGNTEGYVLCATEETAYAAAGRELQRRREELQTILSQVQADYADLRYEKKRETRVTFNGKELTQMGSNTTDGYVLRVLMKGGLSSVAFTRECDAEKAIRTAEENALLISKHIKTPARLAETAAIQDVFTPFLEEDPRQVSMDEKLELTRRYNDLPLKHQAIATTTTEYLEIIREKSFLTTEGSKIREDLITTRIGGLISSRDGILIQNVRVGLGGSHGFGLLRNQEEEFERKTSIALQLLRAKPVEAGVYNVILNPSMAGVFTHEAFGHFSEADLIEDSPTLREKMQLGTQLGNDVLSITDDPTLPNQLGFYKYDDEGTAVKATKLMDHGVLKGRLHSRRTAAAFAEPLSGHCVAEDYRYAPIIRMGNIFIEPSTYPLEELLSMAGQGIYLLDHLGGQTSGENFTFGAQYGYVIKDGRTTQMVRDINISGNLYQTMKNIVAVGNDLVFSKSGGCGKGQMNYRSCNGGPHILVNGVVMGGRC